MGGRRRIDWVQVIAVILTIIGATLHAESQISRLEQAIDDMRQEQNQLVQRVMDLERRQMHP